jgi:hypothetical protein
MRQIVAAVVAALLATALWSSAAAAAPTEVNVRIEGRSETLFEGPISTSPHGVRASSDRLAADKLRRCDGINPIDPENTVPAVTPTAAGADAMSLLGETFDGRWYKQFEDYFVTRWGPDAEDPASNAYWGILVNNTFTKVGGCQYQLSGGDEVLWVYAAFDNRPTLALFPEAAGYASGTRPLTVKNVAPGESVPVEVVSYADDQEDVPPTVPGRSGSSPYAGARVAPVITGAKGFERVEALVGPTTDAQGKAGVSFTEPGWHRVKATVGSPGAESVIRSNRLDICVSGAGGAPLEGASNCGELPAADQVRVAAATLGEIEGPEIEAGASKPAAAGGAAPNPDPGSLQLSRPLLDRKRLAQGRLGVSWKIESAGPGIGKWTISSLAIGEKHAAWVVRASGAGKTKATLTLPRGHAYKLRFAVTDRAGKTSTLSLGKVTVPEAPRRHR